MELNTLPRFDTSDNSTGCCPRFNPEGWDGRHLHFTDKLFLRATTKSVMHIPVNMGSVFTRVQKAAEAVDAFDMDDFIVLSRDLSAWEGEHLFAVHRDVPGEEIVLLSGDFITKVFEGPYRNAEYWHRELEGMARAKGHEPAAIYFFYTTCPKCAKAYGKNYIVGVVQI